jgi:predicted HD superfamily hydrolase involved in NAD metabolism
VTVTGAVERDVGRCLAFLEPLLTPPRLRHSVGVMQVMGELAGVYALDHAAAMAAGLLHDAAKDLAPERQLALAEEAGIAFVHPCERHPVYLHAPVSACVVATGLGVSDAPILEAIAAHSFSGRGALDEAPLGASFEAPLTWCLRFADILAPTREWKGMQKFRSVVYAGRMAEAALLQSGWLVEYFPEIGVPIHPQIVRNVEVLSAELGVDEAFFERW